jgi:DNA-binding transcriptional regulator GbsR (MarR family)
MPTTPGAAKFIEDIALLLEGDGFPRIAGRLFGFLLVSPEPRSLDDLADRLGVTKASISVNARMLEQKGVVERASVAGDRRDYYRIAEDVVERAMQQRVARIRQFQAALGAALTAAGAGRGAVTERLEQMDEGFRFLLDNTNRALAEWRERTQQRASRVRRVDTTR